MKKLVSMVLAVLMILSLSTVIFAAETKLSTSVTATGSQNPTENLTNGFVDQDGDTTDKDDTKYVGSDGSDYYITVPATLSTKGQAGTITIAGVWPTGSTLEFTTSDTVILTNQSVSETPKVLDVTIKEGDTALTANENKYTISLAGDSKATTKFNKQYSISVEEWNPALGNWTGTIEYAVKYTPAS